MNKNSLLFIICLFSLSKISYGKGMDPIPLHSIEGDLYLLVNQKKIKADLLYQLKEMIGSEKFIQSLSRLNETEVSKTDALLYALEKVTSAEVSKNCRDNLMK